MKKAYRIAPEIKEQILNRIKNDGVSVVQAAQDHGVAEGTIYTWIAKKTDGSPTLAEVIKLKRENTQLLQLVGEITLKLSETQKKSC
ncbi:MAG: transposase [Candidatus Vogelbacteria bacterium]|nr:transposase [Candidatus Vogelbacteria bacterium]